MKPLAQRLAVCATLLALAVDVRAQGPGPEQSEHWVKAGYVYNFAKLVEWPAAATPKGQPIVIGVLSNDDFAAVLSRAVEGKKIDDRAFVVKRLKSKDPLKDCGCRILYVGASDAARTDEIVQFQNSNAVLTVADGADFARKGGVVALTLEDGRVRFVVNVDAAAQASLTISSRLLTLAAIVHTTR
jgi:hypothetical protein